MMKLQCTSCRAIRVITLDEAALVRDVSICPKCHGVEVVVSVRTVLKQK
jgi:Zn finger protein HypA/HybF involved in hydrogenase expression